MATTMATSGPTLTPGGWLGAVAGQHACAGTRPRPECRTV